MFTPSQIIFTHTQPTLLFQYYEFNRHSSYSNMHITIIRSYLMVQFSTSGFELLLDIATFHKSMIYYPLNRLLGCTVSCSLFDGLVVHKILYIFLFDQFYNQMTYYTYIIITELLPTCSLVSNSLCSITRCSNESRSRGRDAAVRAAKVRSASSSDACSEVIWSLKLRVAFLLSSERKRGKHCQTVPLDKGHYNPISFMAIVIDFNSHIMSYEKAGLLVCQVYIPEKHLAN